MMPDVQVHSADKEQRFPLLKLEQLNDQQRPFADEILKVSSIGISGPFKWMLRSPVMGQRMFAMLGYVRFNTSVPRKLNEWVSGRAGEAPAYAGTDFIIARDGRISAVYLFFDKLP
jgi:hypothetical protein